MNEWLKIFNHNFQTYISLINSYLLKNGGKLVKVSNAISKLNFSLPDGLKVKHFKTYGKYPIISQSKEFIVGYSDSSKNVIDRDLPLIIFGDHTKVVKYVDFPFIIGADGVKILKPINKIYPKYFYYSIRGIAIDTKNYARHYKLLKNSVFVFIKDIIIQKNISEFLDDFQKKELKDKEYFCRSVENKIIFIHKHSLKINNIKINNVKEQSLLKQLRQAILQEAVEGKLTAEWRKQHPELISGENHAARLLEKIKAEKEKLTKDTKGTKRLKELPPISDDEKPFDLPEGWGWCRLIDYGFTQTGTTPSTTDKSNFGNFIPFIKPADISTSSINYFNEGLSKLGLSKGRLIDKGSILMVCIGGSIGKSYFTDRPVSCNQQINTLTPVPLINVRFLQNFLQSTYFQSEVWDRAMKSSTPIINKGKWEEIPLPLPPLAEQQAIVEKVDRLMAKIDALEEQVKERKKQAEQLMQAVLREAFNGD